MKITPIEDSTPYCNIFEKDSNGREINIYQLRYSIPTGMSLYYPNTLLYSDNSKKLYSPINETTMSLKGVENNDTFNISGLRFTFTENNPVFFFIYNTDNYFHFVYDTLPYLISFFELKKTKPYLKLLMNYPNKSKKEFYEFVSEFLEILGITKDDILIVDEHTTYKEIYLSTSYTHGIDSNLPPRAEIYDFYKKIGEVCVFRHLPSQDRKIYVSRRTWVHSNYSNIGTNYTSRRVMVNEDDVVKLVTSLGYTEVFTELLTTSEKIAMFANAESVVGAIGGGLCNVLFSNKSCKLVAIVSPYFLNVNGRFLHSFKTVNAELYTDTWHNESTNFKRYMRVKYKDIVGEVVGVDNDNLTIVYSNTKVAGWNNEIEFESMVIPSSECKKLDYGLNSAFKISVEALKKYL